MSDILSRHSALWCDQYALTMAQALFNDGRHNQRAVFHAFIRKTPFSGGYLVTGGQGIIADWLSHHWQFTLDDIAQLKQKNLFTDNFLNMLSHAKCDVDIDCMLEGEIAFGDEPIYRVSGPMWQCLLVEAAILNTLNSQSLFATLAARIVYAANGKPVYEMGLRRSQGVDGLSASRGAWLGGVTATANMLAEKYYSIPAMGTMAHAYVMAYENELDSFENFATSYPHNAVFLVDSYDTLSGVRHAVAACLKKNIALKAIRLDSGDLAYLSHEARKILNDAGFPDAKIIASNDLDEDTISSLNAQGADIDAFGVGTHLVTSAAQPSLGAVYKLGAIESGDIIRPVIKISEEPGKTSIPGALSVVRYLKHQGGDIFFDGDTIIDSGSDVMDHHGRLKQSIISRRLLDPYTARHFSAGTSAYCPLVPFFRQGKKIVPNETLHDARARVVSQLKKLDLSHRRRLNPHRYGVGLESALFELRQKMIDEENNKLD